MSGGQRHRHGRDLRVHVEPVAGDVESDEELEQESPLLFALALAPEVRELHHHERGRASVRDHVEHGAELGACMGCVCVLG